MLDVKLVVFYSRDFFMHYTWRRRMHFFDETTDDELIEIDDSGADQAEYDSGERPKHKAILGQTAALSE